MAELSEMSVGYSFKGAQEYLNDLKLEMIGSTKELLRGPEFDKLVTALQEGWVGQSQINFVNALKKGTEQACSDLEQMQDLMENLLGAVEEEMIQRDKNLVDEII